MKATLSRSEALKSKKAKADPRPSGVMLKSKKAAPGAPGKGPPASAAPAKAQGRAKPTSLPPAKPAVKGALAQTVEAGASAAKSTLGAAGSKPKASAGSSKPPTSKAASAVAKASAPSSAKTADSVAPAPFKKPVRKSIKEAAGVSTDAVARRTGKTWDDWFEVLDSAGAATLDQRGIIAILAQKHGIGPWWQQMIAVGYESLRGKSEKPAAPDDFQIAETCTISAPVARVFKLWNDASERARWLADDRFVVKSATPGKALRARWGKGNSQVAVSFSERAGKTEVAVEHQHIESRTAAEQMKAYWQKKLGLLDEAVTERR